MKTLVVLTLCAMCVFGQSKPPEVRIDDFHCFRINDCQVAQLWVTAPAGNHYLEWSSPEAPWGNAWVPVVKLLHPGGSQWYTVQLFTNFNSAFLRVRLAGPEVR